MPARRSKRKPARRLRLLPRETVDLNSSADILEFFGIGDAHGAGLKDPWPVDKAGQLIEAWRRNEQPSARRMCSDCGARIPASHPGNAPATLPLRAVENLSQA
jgi:hypothetical protein